MEDDHIGYPIEFSEDGNRIAIGGSLELIDGSAVGVSGSVSRGVVRIYQKSGSSWNQLGEDILGSTGTEMARIVSISNNGNRVAIGAPLANAPTNLEGSVSIYDYVNGSWKQFGSKINGKNKIDFSGSKVSISGNSNLVAILAPFNNDNGDWSGQVRVWDLANGVSARCTTAADISCGQTISSTTINGNNQFTNLDYTCFQSTRSFSGNDKIFKYTHQEFYKNANVVIWGYSKDLDMFLLKDCNNPASCVKSAKNGKEVYEFIDFTGLPYGDYYIVVDGSETSLNSQFNILVSCQYICAFEGITETIECGQSKTGTTVNSINVFSKYSCFNEYQFTGPEKYYYFTAKSDGEYIIDLYGFSNDLELFVLDIVNCTYSPVCNYKNTNGPGQPEQIKIPLKKNQSITIVVDGALGAAGSYQLKITCPTAASIACEQICPLLITSYRDCHSFEEYALGNISPQKNTDPWEKFESGTDGQVVSGTSKSGSKSLNIKTGTPGTSYSINREIKGIARLEWLMNIPNGGHGGWIISTDVLNYQFPFDVTYLNGTGSSKSKSLQKEELISFAYPQNQWFRTVLIFNSIDMTIELWINNKFIHKIAYEFIVGNLLKVNYLTFKGGNGTVAANFFVDDLCYSEIALLITCEQTYDPVCINGKTFNNDCFARAAGYSENEWIKGACVNSVTCDQICPPLITSYRDCHSFEEYALGNISPQKANDPWIFPTAATDGQVVNSTFKSGSKSLAIKSSALSTYYSINRPLDHISRLEWQMYIPNGSQAGWDIRTAAFNFQFPYDLEYQNGLGSARSKSTAKDEIIGFSFPVNQWFRNVLLFNASDKTIELWINDKFINKITYELAAGAQDMIRELRFKNGSNGAVHSNYFIDDLCYSELLPNYPCTLQFDPVCVNGREFSNSCIATRFGYSEHEWVKGICPLIADKVIFDIDDNVCAPNNTGVKVPVKVYNFKNISLFTLTLKSENSNIATIKSISPVGLDNLLFYAIDPGRTYSIWFSSDNGKTLPDGAIAFEILMDVVGNAGQTSNLSITSDPVEIESFVNLNGQNAKIQTEVRNGFVCILNSALSISGTITTRQGEGINSVNIRLSGTSNESTKTTSEGQYMFAGLQSPGNYMIAPDKNNSPKNGVNIFDLLALQDHILTKKPILDPYKLIAADVNRDGKISLQDFAELQDIALTRKTSFSGNNSWIFIPTNEVLTEQKVKSLSYNTSTNLTNITGDQSEQNFYGIKIGDLEGPPFANPKDLKDNADYEAISLETRSPGDFSIKLPNIKAKRDQEIRMPVTVEKFSALRAFEFELDWNHSILKYQGVESLNNELSNLKTSNIYFNDTVPGRINVLWINDQNAATLPKESKLFDLVFKVVGNLNTSTAVSFKEVYASDTLGPIVSPSFVNGSVLVSDQSTPLFQSFKKRAEIKLYPNPASGSITVSGTEIFEILSISDAFGKRIPVVKNGSKEYILNINLIPDGVYYLQTNLNGRQQAIKFIILR